jgi:hypothetical protein
LCGVSDGAIKRADFLAAEALYYFHLPFAGGGIGFNHDTAKAIVSGRLQQFTYYQIEILCIHLYCTPSDLFIYQPERHHKLPADHPLLRIKSGKPLPKLNKTIASLPVELLPKLQEYVDSLRQPPQP